MGTRDTVTGMLQLKLQSTPRTGVQAGPWLEVAQTEIRIGATILLSHNM